MKNETRTTFPYCGNHTVIHSKVKCHNCEICCSKNDDNAQSILGYEGVKRRIITNVSDETAGYIFRKVSEYLNLQTLK